MAYNSPYTGSQVDSAVNNVNNGANYTRSKTPSSSETPPNNATVTYQYLNSLLPLANNNGGINKYGSGDTRTSNNGKAVHPIGYIFEWSSKKADGTTISGAPDLTTPTKVAQYFGYGTWELFGVGRVTVGIDTDDADFDTIVERGGEKTHRLTTEEMPAHTHTLTVISSRSSFEESGSGSTHYSAGSPSSKETSSTGGSRAHNNLQPYIVVYRWIRIA